MRHLLLATLALLLSACARYDFVPTPVPELITQITYTKADASGKNSWHLDNDTLRVRYMRLSNNGKLIAQRTTKATSNDFNIVATGLEKADFIKATSIQAPNGSRTTERLVVKTSEGERVFTQDSKTRFPEKVDVVTKTIPQLFNR